ncbi:selenium cofactor biosynthesis protein YqeC [uncultured Megasphaera sp.]|uniref:selenium cofactor biosynthesis protein YqeC n=1 Tax=uncultured Megasphaera sp. TaxID=165188 RepID=UPI0025F57FA9|nr:selenium cofactor biosynthesis protein YqeC [uncultured Megasphaera sp.]
MTAQVFTYIGAGGKTTSIFARARQEREAGRLTAVVTTTHMRRPAAHFQPVPLRSDWQETWRRSGLIVAGRLAVQGKITWPGDEIYQQLCEKADTVLVEGDGSKRLPLKVMRPHEPVIPENCDAVYCLAGLAALGQPAAAACFHYELLGLNAADVITEPLFAHIVEAGCLQRLGPWREKTEVVLNQADDEVLRQAGERILARLSRPGGLTSYPKEMREIR